MVDAYMPISLRQRLRHSSWWQTSGIVVLMLAVASIPLAVAYGALADRQAMKAEWAIGGPACPLAAGPSPYRKAPMAFSYQGVRFTRQYGNVSCVVVPDGGIFSSAHHPVCQFSGPARITAASVDRAYTFEPGIGRPATVTIRDGRLSCVIGGWFR
jgi:hypothetical protein